MTHARTAALLLALLLLVTGCTGTTEPRPPTLLVVGYAAGGSPTLALVEDIGPTQTGQRLQFVAGSQRALLGVPVAIDFEDREGARAYAWVLTRASSGAAPGAWLQRFAVGQIDPAAPDAFAEDDARRVVLSGPGGVLVSADLPGRAPCPRAAQVSRTGRWAVVLDDPAACGGSGFPVQWLVDTRAPSSARALRATADTLATPAVTDQGAIDERAYFLTGAIDGAQIFATDFTAPSAWFRGAILEGQSTSAPLDLARSGSVLVGLTTTKLLSLDLTEPRTNLPPGQLEASATSTSRLVTDPFGAAHEVLVLGPNRVELHRSPSLAQVGPIFVRAAAGAIDPVNFFGYLLSEGAITVVDLLTGEDDFERALSYISENLPELALSADAAGRPQGVIGWVWAAPVATP